MYEPYGSPAETEAKPAILRSKCVAARRVIKPPVEMPVMNTLLLLPAGRKPGIVDASIFSIYAISLLAPGGLSASKRLPQSNPKESVKPAEFRENTAKPASTAALANSNISCVSTESLHQFELEPPPPCIITIAPLCQTPARGARHNRSRCCPCTSNETFSQRRSIHSSSGSGGSLEKIDEYEESE